MLFEYKNQYALIVFSAVTKCYFAEISIGEELHSFQASNQQVLLNAIKHVVDQSLLLSAS